MGKKLGGNRHGLKQNKVAKKNKPSSAEELQIDEIPLTQLPTYNQKKSRGRPSSISDKELGFRRLEIQKRLEEHWGEIAWPCVQARRPEDIRKAFAILTPGNSTSGRLIQCLTSPSFEMIFPETLPQTRKRYAQAAAQARQIEEQLDQLTKKLSQLERAKAELTNPHASKLASVKRVLKNLKYVDSQIEDYQGREKNLKSAHIQARAIEDSVFGELELKQSAFARNEVLNFLKSKRYALTPKNFAFAIAGLPFMGWRQSMKRSIKLAGQFGDWPVHPTYQCFMAFQHMLHHKRPRSWEGVAALMKKEIAHLPKGHREAKTFLSENMPWLKEALRKLNRKSLITRKIPYVLAAAFWKAVVHPKSDQDLVFGYADLSDN